MTLTIASPSQQRSQPGFSYRNSYSINLTNAAPVAANYPLIAIKPGPTLNTRIRRLTIWNPGILTAAAKITFNLTFLTAASTGGVTYVPQAMDPVLSRHQAYSGTVLTTAPAITPAALPLMSFSVFVPTTLAGFNPPLLIDFTDEIVKPPLVPPPLSTSTAVGIALICVTGGAGFANLDLTMLLTEEEY